MTKHVLDTTSRPGGGTKPRSTLPRPVATAVGKGWLIATVVAVATVAIISGGEFRNEFGHEQRVSSQPALRIEPLVARTIEYRVLGSADSMVRVSYFDADGVVLEVDASLPWSLSFSTTRLTVPAGVIVASTTDAVSCSIAVDGVTVREATGTGAHAVTSCQAETL